MKLFGHSAQGLPIFAYTFGEEGPCVLFLSGVHGDEPEGIYLNLGLLESFKKSFDYKVRLTLIPVFNPDGAFVFQRTNGNQVDLNRNLPTKTWTKEFTKKKYYPGKAKGSEPENQALIKWIEDSQPKIIFSFHSWKPLINWNGNCQPEAGVLSKELGYELCSDIGYPTPGSLGEYCGLERNIPTITYEVERGLSAQKVLENHVPACKKALRCSEKRGSN